MKLNLLLTLSCLNSNYALALAYLNPASEQPGPGPGCIKSSSDKRALNFCTGTITSSFEIIVTSSLNLKMILQPDPGGCQKYSGSEKHARADILLYL